jgi:hypothetical protein
MENGAGSDAGDAMVVDGSNTDYSVKVPLNFLNAGNLER